LLSFTTEKYICQFVVSRQFSNQLSNDPLAATLLSFGKHNSLFTAKPMQQNPILHTFLKVTRLAGKECVVEQLSN